MKELDLSWCHGFSNTGLLAFATYLNAQHHHHHYGNNDDYVHYSYSSSYDNYHIYHSNNYNSNNNDIYHHNDNHHHLPSVKTNTNYITITTATAAVTHVSSCCLEKLSIEWCSQITDEAMNMISNIKSLKSIHITGCSGITEEGLIYLIRNSIKIC